MTLTRRTPHRRLAALLSLGLCAATLVVAGPTLAEAHPPNGPAGPAHGTDRSCPPDARALGYSDALDKAQVDGITVGGLSSLAYDRRRHAWASAVDNHGTDPARIWFFRDLSQPRLIGPPLVLRRPDGTAYDGTTSDNEGLAVLPDGRYLVSSETEPSIRIYGRDGIQQASLPIPARFAVTGTTAAGQATANATLEGLTISPDGRRIVAAMEGALSGDVSGADATWHRFLVYREHRGGWSLEKQVSYRAAPGQRIPEVAFVGRSDLLVEEASYSPASGNVVDLYLARGLDSAPDVSAVADLATTSRPAGLTKRLVADLVRCPTLGAPAKETQANPLLDNFEGMAVTWAVPSRRPRLVGVSLISDDNFSPTQTTRVLNLAIDLRR